jgi:hypothetical protein
MFISDVMNVESNIIEQFTISRAKSFLNREKIETGGTFFEIAEYAKFIRFKEDSAKLSDGIEFENFFDEESR